MAFLLSTGDPADLRLLPKWVEVPRSPHIAPVDNATEAQRRECIVRVQVCEIPDALFTSLEAEYDWALKEVRVTSQLIGELGDNSEERTRTIRGRYQKAIKALFEARRSLVKWGVCDHKAEDFSDGKSDGFAFLAAQEEYDLIPYRVVDDRLLAAYQLAAPNAEFLKSLADIVCEWQYQRVLTPEDIWHRSGALRERPEQRRTLLRAVLQNTTPGDLLQLIGDLVALLPRNETKEANEQEPNETPTLPVTETSPEIQTTSPMSSSSPLPSVAGNSTRSKPRTAKLVRR